MDHSTSSTVSRQRTWVLSSGKLSPPCSLHKKSSLGQKSELWISPHEERLAGLIFLSETVNHISVTRKNAQNASPVKLAAIISHRADVTAKASPAAGATLTTWSSDLRTWCQSQGAPSSLPGEEQDGDSLQKISMSCGHKPPLCSFTH